MPDRARARSTSPHPAPSGGSPRSASGRRRAVALGLALVPLLLGAEGARAALPPGLNENLTLTHDSLVRTYDVYRAPGAANRPLVVDLHGFTSSADEQRGISGWLALAQAEGFHVVWPDGIANSWNGGTCCGDAVATNVDDVGFVRALVAAIQAEAPVDAGAIYVTGLSNGGAMTQRLACEAADLFAAAAPLAFPVPYVDFANECSPSESIPVLSFMGITDVLVSYAGAAPSFAGWRDQNGCDSAGPAPEVVETTGTANCTIDTSCAEPGVEVGLCSVTGITFDPPLDVFDGHILYFNVEGLDVTARAWDFLRVHRTAPFQVPLGGGLLGLGAALGGAAFVVLRRRAR